MTKVPLFTEHSRSWRDNLFVYPVLSRRSRGLSIGINLNPDKVCNFGCVYCCVDRAVPPAVRQVSLDVLREELRHLLELAATGEIFSAPPFDAAPPDLRRLSDVAFSGDGEPTSYPRFGDACRLVAEEISTAGLGPLPIVLITNATLLHRPAVAEALDFLAAHHGQVWAKLDAGTEAYYRLIERTKVPFQRVLDNLLLTGRKHPLTIQSLFMKLSGQGPTDTEITAYLARLSDLRDGGCQIRGVQVYTVARRTAEDFVTPLSDPEVDTLVERVRTLGLHAEGYYGP
jgi:wyosine [tRNA(Phe)-imidazoG37] synthetase (radical SAM superfamily)